MEDANNSLPSVSLMGRRKLSAIVRTRCGPIQGFCHHLANGQWADIFLGIPYAKPPIGERRFERPEPVEPWTELLQALQFGPASISLDCCCNSNNNSSSSTTWPPHQSEDCLHLNIFRPSPPPLPSIQSAEETLPIAAYAAPTLLPVFFYIHGGGFCSGSAAEYGFQGWTENFVPENLVLITVQYRLGPFGFLSLGDGTSLPGNQGYWDLAMALRFVYENIAAFGGDPERLTVLGLSAGGAAASAMAISPVTRDYVRASVEMSGTGVAGWAATNGRTVEASMELVRRLMMPREEEEAAIHIEGGEGEQCTESDCMDWEKSVRIKQRLKTMGTEQIMAIVRQMPTCWPDPNLLVWGPRLDGQFLPTNFDAQLNDISEKKQSNSAALMGVTEMEAIYFAIQGQYQHVNPFGVPRPLIEGKTYGQKEFQAFVRKFISLAITKSSKAIGEKLDRMVDDVCRFYCCSDNDGIMPKLAASDDAGCDDGEHREERIEENGTMEQTKDDQRHQQQRGSSNATFLLGQYTRLLSDVLFNVPMCLLALMRADHQIPTFLYINRYFNPVQFDAAIPFGGSTHGNEYPYINGLFPVGTFEFDERDRKHQRQLINMLSSFVRDGIPSIPDCMDGKNWPAISRKHVNGKGSGGTNAGPELLDLQFVVIGDTATESSTNNRSGGDSRVTEDVVVESMRRSYKFWMEFCKEYEFALFNGIQNIGK